MLYEDRLEEEMRKVRVGLTIKSGDFAMTDMFPKGEIPEKVRKVVAEIVKTKMLLEYEYHKNDVVKTSIPEVDRTIADVKIEGLFDVEEEEEKIFEVDEILEKITKHGYENLSTEEKEFLDKKSRGEI
jgi:bacterioferritin (cytochrome b1)